MGSARKATQAAAIRPVTGPTVWRGDELKQREDWIHHFNPREVGEVEAALRDVQQRGLSLLEITREDFPLPSLEPVFGQLLRELEGGRGFQLMRGLPLDKYSTEETEVIYWGMGRYLGMAVSQDFDGHIFGHVYDRGSDFTLETARGYQTNRHLRYHSDSSDVVGLLCYRKAKSGGESTIVSSMTLHNVMLEERPQLLEVLYEPFTLERKGAQKLGAEPFYQVPVFSELDGQVTCRYNRAFIENACARPEVPDLTGIQLEALDYLDQLAGREELNLVMDLQLGDIQWLNNYVALHGRNEYVDHEQEARDVLEQRLEMGCHRSSDKEVPVGLPREVGRAHRDDVASFVPELELYGLEAFSRCVLGLVATEPVG